MKRENYISWDEFFIGVAELASKRSKDPRTSHGAVIVNNDNRILSTGYNGLPKGFEDDGSFKGVDYWDSEIKDKFSVHAEQNAILNAFTDLRGSILYLYSERGYYPCSDCAKMIVQSEIKEVVLHHAIKENTDKYNWDYTKHTFEKAGVKIRILNND
jgi:dCMP deaminase